MSEAEEPAPPAGGPMDAAREAAQSFWALLEKRLELAATEFQEQRHRLLNQLLWLVVTVVLALLALITGTILIIALTWETAARNWVIALLTLVYAGGAVWCLATLKRLVTQSPPPFAATIEEFRKDRAWFQRKN
jgi:uncharacterized membrane protein YqjE